MTSSATLVRVEEVTRVRAFIVRDEQDALVRVVYTSDFDVLSCATCLKPDDCEHTARVRLSGLLTHSVIKNVRTRKNENDAATAAKER